MAPFRHTKHLHEHKKTHSQPFDYVVYFFTIATPLFELPQAITIYTTHDAGNVSLLTWSFFLLDNFVWIIYATRRRLVPLIITTILYLMIELSIVIGIVMYK